ncbi:sugar ABC transporter permease [Ktedonosporobacter rubrisoli]|uniref:Sugar ABC transporter permease n=2 Tax=Ktedonosporobacter rubrisoli TaxID=2509675 RepID=A0A4V0Z0L7_KTERU|nr:sugar ABC transporter permease [Ktedonosporobacter rubrisoli]
MIAPLFLGLLIFYIWPAIQTFYFSFTKWGAFGKYSWTGLNNYAHILSDPDIKSALLNTLIYTVLSVPGSIVASLIVAILLNQKIRGVGIYRTLYFLPAVTMPAAIAVVWRWLYNGDYGLINAVLRPFGIHGPHWISDPHTALLAAIVVAIWSSIGNNMVLFLAGLQSIPSTYHEAAALDGASRTSRFLRITLPLLSPTIFFVIVMSMISAFQVFDLIYLMFGAGSTLSTNPALGAAQTIVYLFYQNAFMVDNKGYAAAIAIILFVIILCVTAVQFRLQKRWVHYS